jgi:hypothetical protein
MGNGGNGFFVTNAALPGNKLVKLDAGEKATPNGQDGVHVEGNGNSLTEVDAFANGGDGIEVLGNSNALTKNVAGDKGKGNGQDGIRVVGTSNSLVENKSRTNGWDGFDISGGTSTALANKLKKNESNTGASMSADYENGLFEYNLAGYVKNDTGGNKADSIVVPKTSAPTKCTTFPATNATSNAAITCE